MESGTGTTATPGAPPAGRGRRDPGDSASQAPLGALPNLIVIGAQKCGTSGLHYYLSLHPETSMSKPKELNFFIAERSFPRGLDWYRAHFDARATVRGEASPNYTAYPQHVGVPERMHSVVPDAKLLYMVRDPIDRIAAHWIHNYAKRREKGDLRTTLMHPNTSYLARSLYYTQLQQFLRVYPLERILLVEQEELRTNRIETLRRVFEFIGVDPGFSHARFSDERHKTSRKTRATPLAMRLERIGETPRGRAIPPTFWRAVGGLFPFRRTIEVPEVREALPDEALRSLREDAERLRELTGREFATWSIWT
ncbi:MAG: sulfotransferase family protein [Solirubrobacterales bacterium]